LFAAHVQLSNKIQASKSQTESVVTDPEQPGVEFVPDVLRRFAHNIREHGQSAPIRVRRSDGLGEWLQIDLALVEVLAEIRRRGG
jgi:hypothetical protein